TFVVSFLTLSSLVYLITRDGALQRFAKHKRVPRAILDAYFSKNKPAITVLVPSYSEEYSVIRKTILSAVFQEYPDIRVMLLVDDKPNPTNADDKARLEMTRNIGEDIKMLLDTPYSRFNKALNTFRKNGSESVSAEVVNDLIDQYQYAAEWFNLMAENEVMEDHVDEFFADQVLRAMAQDLTTVAEALEMSLKDSSILSRDRVEQLYQRLVWIFTGKVEVFERKQYLSLSHEANKAMNLNAYISLMGGTYEQIKTDDDIILEKTDKKGANTITFKDSEFLLTLDADSILLREYCLRLVYLLRQPENEKVAVTQTPYSSFRGAYTRIERLAGATTDIQHVLHQGMTYHGATFWVGANAVIRKAALIDIEETDWERGFEIKRYIQDRTVIEDTESSIDLALHGWSLVNYPERLSYSATPPDFGSLVVQRRRWANGGLIILQKFFSVIRQRKHNNELISRAEILLRVNYLVSIAWATFGLIFLLAYPYDGRLLSPLILLAALPYFLTMASDLRYNGYSAWDVFSIYGFNLILLPVNLAGVIKSVEQAITNKKIPFARTPKVKDRTPSGLFYVIMPVLIVAFSLFTVYRNVLVENWGNALFAGFNATVATWAILAYMGIGNVIADIWLGFTDWLYVEATPKKKKEESVELTYDWRNVLYQGDTKGITS
ncbi:glycosyltransferase family 2 protein, partial [candidate division WWE3 bacterium]|nr:glycosyltransferase family 2 protein [candidate division WWE3 bacterium]